MSRLKFSKDVLFSKNFFFLVILVAIFLSFPSFLDPYSLHVLTISFFYAALATTYNMVAGYTGQLSFAQAAFSMVGGYTTGILVVHFGFPSILTLFIGGFAALLVGICVAALTLRVRGPYFILVTISIGEVAIILVQNEWEITRGIMGLRVPPLAGITSTNFYYYLIFAILAIMLVLLYKIERSSFGLSLKAIREDEDVAEQMGVNTLRQKVLVFAIASFFAGLCGAFYAHYMRLAHPTQGNLTQMLIIMAASLIGGSGTLFGPVIGAFIYEIMWEAMRPLAASEFLGLHLVIFSVILILVIRVAPTGIWGALPKIKSLVWPSPTRKS